MTALTQDTPIKTRGRSTQIKVAIGTAGTIYVGSLANQRSTTGRALAATAATGRHFLGLVTRLDGPNGQGTGTGVGNTAGDQYAIIEHGCEAVLAVKTSCRTNTSLGLNLFVADDATVGGTAVGTAGKQKPVGELTEFYASDKSTGWVAIRRFAKSNIAV